MILRTANIVLCLLCLAGTTGCMGRCETDADCDDGKWCNGTERCGGSSSIGLPSLPFCWSLSDPPCGRCPAVRLPDCEALCIEDEMRCEVGDECETDEDCIDDDTCTREFCTVGLCASVATMEDSYLSGIDCENLCQEAGCFFGGGVSADPADPGCECSCVPEGCPNFGVGGSWFQ